MRSVCGLSSEWEGWALGEKDVIIGVTRGGQAYLKTWIISMKRSTCIGVSSLIPIMRATDSSSCMVVNGQVARAHVT